MLGLSVGGAGCMGTLGAESDEIEKDGGESANPKTAGNSGSLPDLDAIDCSDVPLDPGNKLIRLLSRTQYENTLEELVGVVPGVDDALATYIAPSTLGVPQAPVNANEVEGFHRAAEIIAAHVVQSPETLSTLAPCSAEEDPLVCARNFVETFGGRAYRAPLLDEEDIERHLTLFQVGLDTSYERGIELLLRGMMQSPRFLYQLEIGTSDQVSTSAVKLRPHELAARLSYAIWNTLPDAELVDAAESGTLDDPLGLIAQVDRLLADPRGEDFVQTFLEAWTHLDRVPQLAKHETHYPMWPEIRDATKQQARTFFDHILNVEGGTLTALLTSSTVMINDVLAPHYGVSAGPNFQPFDAPLGTPSGVLTLPSLMATFAKMDESSPIHRGVFIREALFCQSPPAPPADIPPPPEVDSGGSTRERLAQHVVDPACAGCHQLLDPVGLGFEHYDAVGLFRSDDGGKPVDATGKLAGTDVDGTFEGVPQLAAMLLESESVEQCITRQWFRYALSRFEDDDADLCSIKGLVERFRDANQSLNALPHAVVESPSFLYRRPSDAEVTP